MSSIKYQTTDGGYSAIDDLMIYELEELFNTKVIFPHSKQYDEERQVWNGEIDKKPAFIIKCHKVSDVKAAVKFASRNDFKMAIRSTGHHVAGSSVIDHGMVIDLSQMKDIAVDTENRTASVQAGTTWGDLDAATQEHGLATPGGVVSDTGISGLTLGGGYGWLRRKYGLASDNVREMKVVTAEGELITVNSESHSDLFWALRGGSGNFGIVVEFTYDLYPVGPDLYMAVKFYQAETNEEATEVLENYVNTCDDLDNTITSMALLGWVPAEDFIPEEYHDKKTVIILGVYSEDPADGPDQLAPLDELGTKLVDLSDTMPYTTIQTFFDEDYPDGMHYYWSSLYFDQIDRSILAEIVEQSYQSPSHLTTVDLWHLGGKIHDPENEGAITYRDAIFLLGIESNWTDEENSQANIEWNCRCRQVLKPKASSGGYVNFSSGEDTEVSTKEHYQHHLERLSEIKNRYDPDGIFHTQIKIQTIED